MRIATGDIVTFCILFKNHGYLGDRTVSCLQESFGLSVVDPDKLDRLVRVNTANAGECFNEAPETGWFTGRTGQLFRSLGESGSKTLHCSLER